MKLVTSVAIAALFAAPSVAMAQKGTTNTLPNQPGQSEFAPGQRATHPGEAKKFAPGQRMHTKDVKKVPGASEYAPGHQPGPYTNQGIRR